MKILLPEGSSMSARDIVYALGKEHEIDVLDPSLFCQLKYSSLVRKCYKCPSYWREPDAYLAFLVDRLQQEKYDVLLPTHEQTYLLSKYRDQLGQHVGLAVPEFSVINRLQSKAEFSRLLDEMDLPGPPTRIVRNRHALLQQDQFPCFIKVDYSTAGNGVQRVDNATELAHLADRFESDGVWEKQPEVLVQEVLQGHQFTALGIFDRGRMVGGITYLIRRPGIGGWGMNGESVDHPDVLQQLSRMGRHLDFHGPLFLDYFRDENTDEMAYIEANPRFATALFPKWCGLPLIEQFLRLSTGESPKPLEPAKAGIRFHHGFLMLISAAKSGASRRELWRECRDAWKRRGFYENSRDAITRPSEDRLSLIPAIAVTTLLLIKPSASQWLVRKTLSNYTLPAEGARAIREMNAPIECVA